MRSRGHLTFLVLLGLGALLRGLAVVGYRPALWFWADSFSYLNAALELRPLESRPAGYALFLAALGPLESVRAVAVAQHLMGLALAIGVYALLVKRTRLPNWAAALFAAPVLLDVHQIQLEHLMMADLLFTFLVGAAVLLLLWERATVLALVLLALATITRTIGLPLLVLAVVWLLITRVGWRRIAGGVAAAALVLGGYAVWYHSMFGAYGLGGSNTWLWSRTMTFADCAKMNPSPKLAVLCPDPGPRLAAPTYIWSTDSPLDDVLKDKDREVLTSEFAMLAIRSQPVDFVLTGLRDALWAFHWDRIVYPAPGTQSAYIFPEEIRPFTDKVAGGTRSAPELTTAYQGHRADTQVSEPYAGWLRAYEQWGYLRGPFLAALFLAAIAGLVRRFDWSSALALAAALALLVLPPLIAAFDHRYVVPVVPLACVAAGLGAAAFLRSTPHDVGADQRGKARINAA